MTRSRAADDFPRSARPHGGAAARARPYAGGRRYSHARRFAALRDQRSAAAGGQVVRHIADNAPGASKGEEVRTA